MADFGLYYPTFAAHEDPGGDKWEPSVNPQLPIELPEDEGIVTTVMPDRLIIHEEQVGTTVREFPWIFRLLPDADLTTLRGFRATVKAAALGRAFEMIEPISGTTYTAKFATWRFAPRREERAALWSLELPLREADSA